MKVPGRPHLDWQCQKPFQANDTLTPGQCALKRVLAVLAVKQTQPLIAGYYRLEQRDRHVSR